MIKLVYFELKKLLNLYSILIIMLLIIANIVNISINYNLKSDVIYDKGYSQVYNDIKGEITNEKILTVVNQLNRLNKANSDEDEHTSGNDTYTGYIFGDLSVYQTVYDELYYAANYNNMIKDKIEILDENILHSSKKQKKQEYEEIINRFQNRTVKKYFNTEGITSFLEYDFSTILVILFVVLSTALLFTIDRDTEMNLVINVSCVGKRKKILSKLVAIFFICFLATLTFRVLDYAMFKHVTYLEGFLNPLFSLPKYKYTFTNITIIGYLMIDTLFKILIINLFVLMIIFFSFFIKKSYLLFGISIFIIIYLLHKLNYIFIFPIALIQTNIIFETGNLINIFGIFLDAFFLQILYLIFLLIVLSWIINILYKKYQLI